LLANIIADDLHLDRKDVPKIKAEIIANAKLVRVSLKSQDVEFSKSILTSLFEKLKESLDEKVDIEMEGIKMGIANNENLIEHKNLEIKDNLDEIKLKEIEKNKTQQEIISSQNKLKISEEREESILVEMRTVKKRIDEIDKQQREMLKEKKEGMEALNLLLYSNEIQNNLQYYNTLDEELSQERITQEDLNLQIKNGKEEIRKFSTQIDKTRTAIDKIKNEMKNVENEINLLKENQGRVEYAQLIKDPTSSRAPVAPRKKLNVMIAGVFGLVIFTFLAFFLEYVKKQKM